MGPDARVPPARLAAPAQSLRLGRPRPLVLAFARTAVLAGTLLSVLRAVSLTTLASAALAQLDVSVDGPLDTIVSLERSDFKLEVDGQAVEAITVDRFCAQPVADAESTPPRASFLFYFDQPHLTMTGRPASVEVARDLVRRLIVAGNRASIVSAAHDELTTFVDWTSEPRTLLAALDRLDSERTQVDDYSALEESQEREVMEEVQRRNLELACRLAHQYQQEELARTERALALLSETLSGFATIDPPKTIVYFGDTARLDAGRHYFAGVGDCGIVLFDARGAFRHVIEDAAVHGVRIYAVQAAGLTPPIVSGVSPMREMAARDSQAGLKGIALDTGGDAFLGGASTKDMEQKISTDTRCVYLLSFDPSRFVQDRALDVRVRVARSKVHVRTRKQIVFESAATRRTSPLLAAARTPDAAPDRESIGAAVIPLGATDDGYRALVQAAAPPSLVVGEDWDIGISVVSGGAVRDEVSRRIAVSQPGSQAVLEAELTFGPGPFRIVLQGQEKASGRVANAQIEDAWPALNGEAAAGPLVVLQPAAAVFVRGDELRNDGALAIPRLSPARGDRSITLVGLVCRGPDPSGSSRVERTLLGEDAPALEPIDLVERCTLVRDMVRGGALAPGTFVYEVRLGERLLARREIVVEP